MRRSFQPSFYFRAYSDRDALQGACTIVLKTLAHSFLYLVMSIVFRVFVLLDGFYYFPLKRLAYMFRVCYSTSNKGETNANQTNHQQARRTTRPKKTHRSRNRIPIRSTNRNTNDR